MYQSPIEIITKKMRTQFEDNVFKAIQDYGIVVDKEELIKALQYDRDQYEKGYADGMLAQKDEWISVEERLPETNMLVLIYVFFHNQWQIVKGWLSYCDKKFHIANSDYPSLTDIPVTHWMPLPEPPKKGGAE